MAINPPKRQAPKPERSVIRWLLDSDPSIRWQVMRDLTYEPADVVAAERAKVATEGWGAHLLVLQGADERWGQEHPNPCRGGARSEAMKGFARSSKRCSISQWSYAAR